ncbi:MAG: LURP-one-related family protein [Promethearchaeota archaeon]
MANFCPKCGDPLEPGQKFCEKCGAKIEEHIGSAQVQTVAPQPVSSGGLFDPSRNFYILKEKYWDWGSGPILDEQGNEIGKMHRKLLSLRARIDFMELDGTISASIHKKIISIKPTYDLKDAAGNQLARLKKTFWSFIRPKFYLEDPQGNKIMEAQGKFMGFDFTITDMNGKLIGTIKKADRWRDVFLGGIFDFADTYALKVEDPNVDRRLLLGFVIAIDNTLHDNRSRGMF